MRDAAGQLANDLEFLRLRQPVLQLLLLPVGIQLVRDVLMNGHPSTAAHGALCERYDVALRKLQELVEALRSAVPRQQPPGIWSGEALHSALPQAIVVDCLKRCSPP